MRWWYLPPPNSDRTMMDHDRTWFKFIWPNWFSGVSLFLCNWCHLIGARVLHSSSVQNLGRVGAGWPGCQRQDGRTGRRAQQGRGLGQNHYGNVRKHTKTNTKLPQQIVKPNKLASSRAHRTELFFIETVKIVPLVGWVSMKNDACGCRRRSDHWKQEISSSRSHDCFIVPIAGETSRWPVW